MKLNTQIFGWLGVSALLLSATSCVNDSLSTEPQLDQTSETIYGNGSQIVTINVTPDSYVGTRAISDGTGATSLYFEVYQVENENVTVSAQSDGTPATPTLISLISGKAVNVSNYKTTLKIAVDPTYNYRIALWAQKTGSDYTSPFTIAGTPLTITVDYSKVKNNNEDMDAFCATKYFPGTSQIVDVILHRPFAQLNVGTTGADYKNYMQGNILPNKTIKYSQIVVSDIYTKLDVANDKVIEESKVSNPVKLAYDVIPAFSNYTTLTGDGAPSNFLTTGSINASDGYVTLTPEDKEEFLKVNLNNPKTANAALKGYKTAYPTVAKNKSQGDNDYFLTETFKYLSMSYVLVASKIDDSKWSENLGSKKEEDIYLSSTLGSVEVYFAEEQENGQKYFTVKNVPVHRNWRTNLLGGLKDTEEDPDDPNKPDDPSSVFYNVKIAVHLCPIYFGEYNGFNDGDKDNHFDGYFQGYFPTGENDLHDKYHPETASTK